MKKIIYSFLSVIAFPIMCFSSPLSISKEITFNLPGRGIPELATPVFSHTQMAKGTPSLIWQKISEQEEKITLTKEVAGLDLDGVVLTRLIQKTESGITIRFTLENKTSSMRYASFGFRSKFSIGEPGVDRNYIPTENNVLDLDCTSLLWEFYTRPGEWFFDLVEPWFAVLNGKQKGVAYLADYQVVSAAYLSSDMLVRGMMIDGGKLPPGATFSTQIKLLPLNGLNSVATVTEHFSAGFGKKDNVVLELLPYQDGIYSGEVTVRDVKENELGKKTIQINGKAMRLSTCSIDRKKPTTQTVNYAKINGVLFEQYQENGFRTRTFPYCPLLAMHKRTVPERALTDKGSNSSSKIQRQKKALLLFGFYANFFRFDKILSDWKLETISATPQGISVIPPAATIDEYQFIILGDVNWESVRPMMTRLNSYVKNGGVLVVCGGPFAYGCGGYANSALDKLLPVIPEPFDLRPAAGDGVFDKGIAFDQKVEKTPQVWWLHKVQCKKDGEILMKAGGMPLIVKGKYGNGTVIAFLGSPLGNPEKGENPFWNSEEYTTLMKQILSDASGLEVK